MNAFEAPMATRLAVATDVRIEVVDPDPPNQSDDTVAQDTAQFLSVFHFRSRETECAYRRFHLDLWRGRVRFLCVAAQVVGLFYTLSARLNDSRNPHFRMAVEEDFPEESKYNLAFTMFIRYGVVTLAVAASCSTRYDPLRRWFAGAVSSLILLLCIGELGPTILTLWRTRGEHMMHMNMNVSTLALDATNEDDSWQTRVDLAGSMAAQQMATYALFVMFTSSVGISIGVYLLHATLQLLFFEVLHRLCWSYFFGDATPVPVNAVHRVVLGLYGVFVVMVNDTNTRSMFTAHLHLEAEKNRRIEQLSREKQRINWEWQLLLSHRDEPSSAPRTATMDAAPAAATEMCALAAPAPPPATSAVSSTSANQSEPELAHIEAEQNRRNEQLVRKKRRVKWQLHAKAQA